MSNQDHNINRCKAVILVGDRDFGRCPLASQFNRALWPVFDKPALQVLLEQLDREGIRRVVISCANESQNIRQSIECPPGMNVSFQEKTLPRGPAGSIRDAAEPNDERFLVISGNVLILPPFQELLKKHQNTHADMTVFLNPDHHKESSQPVDSQIYLCERSILSCIPETGYFDLKEGFVPLSIQSGLTITGVTLSCDTRHYRNWIDYVNNLNSILLDKQKTEELLTDYTRLNEDSEIWIGSDVHISKNAKIYGPILIGSHSTVSEGAMIFGPAVIGEKTNIGPDCLIEESILWDHVTVAAGSRVRNCLINSHSWIARNSEIVRQLITSSQNRFQRFISRFKRNKTRKQIGDLFDPDTNETSLTLQQIFKTRLQKIIGLLLVLSILLSLIISYWKPTIRSLVAIWLESDEYSSGLLVPIIAIYVLWLRRDSLRQSSIHPSLWALGMLFFAQGVRFFGLYYMYGSAVRMSLLLTIGAVVMFLLGWTFFKKFWSVFLFLFLMLPLPRRVEGFLTVPLQSWATVSSVFCLEALGFSVAREGNVININGTLVAVAEACNGLRMLTAFIVVCGLVALTIHRSWQEKLVVLLSSIPIALACNTLRLIVTAIAFTKLDTQRWEKIFHDFGGFAMMPVAILIVLFELWLLSQLFIKPKKKQEQVIYRKGNELS